ncbi:MAG TPA: SIMPL domain-containing protein [Candidatus Angelobacter sp.]|nr:SIMPL domain-containing protein [Candidatus Angelobacter sp.]
MRVTLCSLVAVLLTACPATGQTPTPVVQANTIFAGADGKFEAAPDTAVLRLDIAAQQDTSRAAYDHAAAAADRVRQVIKSNGLDAKDLQIGFYSVQPMYDWKNPKHKVVGYRVSTNLTLKLRDFAKIGGIIEQTADIDDMQNQALSYTLESVDAAKAKAAEDALHKARNQAAAVAAAGGRTLGELLYASVDVTQPVILAQPMVQRAAMAGNVAAPAPTAEFTPQSVTINAHVNAMFALK